MIDPKLTISKKIIPIWKLSNFIGYTVILFIISIAFGILSLFYWSLLITYALFIIIFLLIVGLCLETTIIPVYKHRNWTYDLDSNFIYLSTKSILLSSKLVIPLNKIQYVDTKEGLIMRRYRVCSVSIMTVSSEHEIAILAKEDAEILKNKISNLAYKNSTNLERDSHEIHST